MIIIIGSPDPSFNPIELEVENNSYFEKEYYNINDENLIDNLYYYARDIIGRRWPEAEPIIMQDPAWAYTYALRIIKGRWEEAESIIKKNPKIAYWYAFDVIGGRWPEAEPYIMQNPEYLNLYEYNNRIT